ncbi:hypothetical protein [Ruminococcus sp. AF31-8BH]|uniref:hypothetical protein n=1 Tax=Ruminococcus sp. AF31-8BH TaxID=2293174 RepID=UPI000E470338|nr:hypothetical protein [Ruminococcus sp. AF31-8BH]RGF77044.1 hypothetical protein DWZ38_03750 [Ruminococcus sp. AF31-8BH]
MSRLIDADKIIDSLGNSDMDFAIGAVIDEQPTAFDVDEIVQQLEMLIEDKCSESGDDWYTAQCLNEAVEIVKGGGVDGN